jgi:transcriptional regulator with XRE-family HTH domain
MTQEEFGNACGKDQSYVSLCEQGEAAPSEETLRRMAKSADETWPVVVHLRRFYEAALAASARRSAASSDGASLDGAVTDSVLLAITPYLVEDAAAEPARQRPGEARREAREIWSALERFPIPKRRRLIERTLRASRSPALAISSSTRGETPRPHSGSWPKRPLGWNAPAIPTCSSRSASRK